MLLMMNCLVLLNVCVVMFVQIVVDLFSFVFGNMLFKVFIFMFDNLVKGWQVELKGRIIIFFVFECGNDGVYFIIISGSFFLLLCVGIDKYVYGYGFYCISELEQIL